MPPSSLLFTERCNSLRAFLSVVLCFCCMINANANTYYFSSSGNDSYTNVQAQNPATPWRSISKLNTIFNTLLPNDSVLLKRGDVFYGTINVSASGIFKRPVVLGAYGTGARPVVSGFTALTTWTAAGNGIYQASLTGAGADLNMVVINSQPQQIGRYPNADAANGGYLTYESFNDTLSITDSELTSATNWTGAEVVIRKKLWVLDRCKITAHTGNTIFYSNTNGSTYDCSNNYGYFFQNDIRTLDQFGEWYFNPVTKQLSIYFGSNAPSGYSIKAATIQSLVNINFERYITITGIAFEGGNLYGISANSSDYININDCSVTNIGGTGIYMEHASQVLIQNTSTYNLLSNAIRLACFTDSSLTIQNCVIKKTGVLRGMGSSGSLSYKAVSVDLSKNLLIQNNRVDTSGYVGIEFDGSNVLVKNNVVNYFGFNKDDAGGIYTWIPQGTAPELYSTNRVISGNIVMNGIGAAEGRSSTNPYVSGIYLDGQIANVDVVNNTIFNVAKNGIHCNNPTNVNITGNTCFNTLNAMSFMRWSWGDISNLKIRNNIFYPRYSAQRNLYYTNAALNEPVPVSLQSVLQSLGSIDSNYYSSSNLVGFNYEVYATTGGTLMPLSPQSLDGWRAFSNNDLHSKKPFREAPAYLLRGTIGNNSITNGAFTSNAIGITLFGGNATAAWDGNNRIAGGSLKVQFPSPVPNRYVLLYGAAGTVGASKNYVLRFSTLGTTANGIIKVYLRKTGSPYTTLTPVQMRTFDTSIRKHELIFSAPATDVAASFVFEIEQNSGTTYIDNIEFYEADATVYNPDNYLRFEYNASTSPQTISLADNYIGVDGTYYHGTITLEPFTSKILVKDTSVIRQPLSINVYTANVNCFGETATVTVTASGGIPPYTGTGTFEVPAGRYTYTIKDLRGVSASTAVTVTQPAAPLVAAATAGSINIFGGVTTVSVTASGGTPPYNGTITYRNVFAGTYTYSVKDARGCSDTVTISIKQPLPLRAMATASAIACFGGTTNVLVKALGGIAPYSGTGSFTVVAGVYSYTVRDAAGAVNTVSITITQPAASLQVTASAGTIAVTGGTTSVNISASGGTAPYTGTGIVNNVAAGSHVYTVTDSKGCSATGTVNIPSPPAFLTATAVAPPISCFDGSSNATVTATGGTPPYTGTGAYPVTAGKGSLKISFASVIPNRYTLVYFTVGSVSSTKNYALRFSTLGTTANGNFRVVLRQTSGSLLPLTDWQQATYGTTRVDHEFIFTAPTTEPAASFLIELNQNSGTTYIDNIAFFELTANGKPAGVNKYAFGDMENGISTIFTYSSNSNHTAVWDTTRKIASVYYFPVTDALGNSANAVLQTSQPASALQVSITAGTITAANPVTSVTVTATGGTPGYTGTGTFTNIGAGTHNFVVTDANGCTSSRSINLSLTGARPAYAGSGATIPAPALRMEVFPNPTASAFELLIDGDANERAALSITTADGKLVYAAAVKASGHYTLGENLTAGLYVLKLVKGTVVKTVKLIKIR